MNSYILKTVVFFFSLLVLQVFVFNHINFLGGINPMLYLLFLINYRFDQDQTFFILLGFLLGFSIDLLSQTGGAHTIAALSISFLRPFIIRYSFGVIAETPKSFQSSPKTLNRLIFLFFTISIHHLIYFIFVYFSWDALYLILKNTFLSSIFSLILVILINSLYRTKQ